MESSFERFRHDTLQTDRGSTQKCLSISTKGKRALIAYILMELNSPQKRKNNKLLQVFSKSLYQTMKNGSIVGAGLEGGCGEYDSSKIESSVDIDIGGVRSQKPTPQSFRSAACP